MRFQVPQFIEVEDKIFGPLTFKQFLYVGGGAGASAILFTLLPKFFAIILSLPIVAFAGALAFYKPNSKPFVNMVESFFKYYVGNKLYIWKKEEKQPVHNEQLRAENNTIEQVQVPKLSSSKLKQLTWELDITQNQNPVTIDQQQTTDN
jgi:hypothetical protein